MEGTQRNGKAPKLDYGDTVTTQACKKILELKQAILFSASSSQSTLKNEPSDVIGSYLHYVLLPSALSKIKKIPGSILRQTVTRCS